MDSAIPSAGACRIISERYLNRILVGIALTIITHVLSHRQAKNAYFWRFQHSNGKTTVTYRQNRTPGSCPPGLPSLAVSLGKVTNNAGVLIATTVTRAEYGMQGVVFAIDGHYVSAVTAAGPYNLKLAPEVCPAARTPLQRRS